MLCYCHNNDNVEHLLLTAFFYRSWSDLCGLPRGCVQTSHLSLVGCSLLPHVVCDWSGQPGRHSNFFHGYLGHGLDLAKVQVRVRCGKLACMVTKLLTALSYPPLHYCSSLPLFLLFKFFLDFLTFSVFFCPRAFIFACYRICSHPVCGRNVPLCDRESLKEDGVNVRVRMSESKSCPAFRWLALSKDSVTRSARVEEHRQCTILCFSFCWHACDTLDFFFFSLQLSTCTEWFG